MILCLFRSIAIPELPFLKLMSLNLTLSNKIDYVINYACSLNSNAESLYKYGMKYFI